MRVLGKAAPQLLFTAGSSANGGLKLAAVPGADTLAGLLAGVPAKPVFLDTNSALFFDAVRRAGRRDYSQAQVEASAPAIPHKAWFEARAKGGRLILVAVDEVDEPIAYGDLEPNGHIDHWYCRTEFIGSGTASALYDRLEQQARERGITRLFVEASEAARKLFLRKGFAVVKRRDFLLRGVKIHNHLMEKLLFMPP
jgi:putative acetyltransferase